MFRAQSKNLVIINANPPTMHKLHVDTIVTNSPGIRGFCLMFHSVTYPALLCYLPVYVYLYILFVSLGTFNTQLSVQRTFHLKEIISEQIHERLRENNLYPYKVLSIIVLHWPRFAH